MNKTIRFYNYLFIIIAAFPLIGMRIEVYVIILWVLLSLTLIIRNKNFKLNLMHFGPLIILSSYYLMAVMSFLFFSEHLNEALKDLETKGAFIVFPFFMYSCKDFINTKTLKKVLISFTTSNIILAIYIWWLIYDQGFLEMLERDSYNHPVFRTLIVNNISIYLPYLGLLFGFSCIILMHFFIVIKPRLVSKVAILFLVAFLLVTMAIFSARMAIFASIFSIMYYILKVVNNTKRTVTVILIIIVTSLLFLLPPVKRRIQEITKSELVLPNKAQLSENVNFRYGIYYCSKEVLKINWLFGLGLGDVQNELNLCYQDFDYRNFDDFTARQYNSHNQYLNEWMTYGIFGLGLFVYFLYYFFKKGTTLHKSFLILIFLSLLTENLFEREIGVMLFAFFNTLFFLSNKIITK